VQAFKKIFGVGVLVFIEWGTSIFEGRDGGFCTQTQTKMGYWFEIFSRENSQVQTVLKSQNLMTRLDLRYLE
jgi:hypothetical protein